MANFITELEASKKGEIIFENFMKTKKLTGVLENATNNREYQKYDIDFVYTTPSGIKQTYEIKYDTIIHKTNNVFLETEIVFENTRKTLHGFLYKSKADILVYIDSVKKIIYAIDFNKLKEYVNKIQPPKKYTIDCMTSMDKDKYKSYGYVVSVNKLKENQLIKEEYKFT